MSGVEIPNWLKKLPLAPEFYPTDTEFADPIAYISKIEKEASAFGICKVIPPLPKPPKKYTYSNLNKSLSKFPDLGSDLSSALGSSSSVSSSGNQNGDVKAVFTTRHQELGYSSKRSKGSVRQSAIHKQVWQSGEVYTLDQFETKAKVFAKNQLGTVKDVPPLTVETLFWKASCEKPIYVEYANDVPGSGFGEPDFPNRYFHKQRRKRTFGRRDIGCEKREIGTEGNSNIDRASKNYMKIDSDLSLETGKQSPSSESMLSDECQRLSKNRNLDTGNDREGSAGWKLSNSPWNLQVIARSPGSLTRFMLDDIPGVTSPMIYIGMLYSWFAWHVEDHELHSLNYLHTGSPKTWYAVPGDRAVAFEEIVCSQGYGGTIDRLAALTLLGEKTNLLSPEVVVASGLPCCRLVQYPGEFVVTFPRAYHVGFSHGFNCGEAANFGTPQWLKVAKEAAVRRAAMDLLPMLSHQQLLYMLTMSFISRVPRALLLPGARSSRSRDRQKEERELLVKKAFIDDMVSESNLLLDFLKKECSSYVVTWDPDLLPSTIKDFQSSPSPPTVSGSCLLVDGKRDLDTHSLADENIVGSCDNPVALTELSMETGEDLYENENELPCGLHAESGALVCVACGILGFPFMTIVQPSRCASEKLLHLADSQMLQEGQELQRSVKPPFLSKLDNTTGKSSDTQGEENQKVIVSLKHNDHVLMDTAYNGRNFRSVDVDQDTKVPPMHPTDKVDRQRSGVDGFLRPRIFCLEHGLEIKDLLHSKGGADVLIICHSAYQKIKAHASAVAEELGVSLNCKEVPLRCASQEDLKLINMAIDNEKHEEGGEDWTSRMGINLQYRVKLKKLFPSKQDNYALVLRGLLPDKNPHLDMSSLKWNSKKIRTPVITTGLIHYKFCGNIQIKEVKPVEISATNKIITGSDPIQTKSGKNLQVKEDVPLDISGIDKVTAVTSPSLSELCENKHIGEDKSMVVSEGYSVDGKTSLSQFKSCDNSQTKEEKPVEILGTCSIIQSKIPGEFKLRDETQIEEDQSVEVSERKNTIILYSRRARNKKMGLLSQPNSCPRVARTDTQKESETSTPEPVVCQRANTMTMEKGSEDVIMDSIEALHKDKTVINESNQPTSLVMCNPGMQPEDEGFAEESATCNQANPFHQPKVSVVVNESSEVLQGIQGVEEAGGGGSAGEDMESKSTTAADPEPGKREQNKRSRELDQLTKDQISFDGFIKGPCEGLRPRSSRTTAIYRTDSDISVPEEVPKKSRNQADNLVTCGGNNEVVKEAFACNIEKCQMRLKTKTQLLVHKQNQCTHKGCGKRFSSHKKVILHQRVHAVERPLKCSWEGCNMSFKWAWARTEHLRLHTGERPYECKVLGCGLTFRFVSDYSRHRRKTGHYVNSPP